MLKKTTKGICKACHADIIWLKTPNGKSMPCDAEPVYYKEKQNGSQRVITPNGEVLSCEYVADPYKATGIGYAPHWATCPAANSFRKKGEER